MIRVLAIYAKTEKKCKYKYIHALYSLLEGIMILSDPQLADESQGSLYVPEEGSQSEVFL